MGKRIALIALAALLVFALSGCAQPQPQFPEATPRPTDAPYIPTPEASEPDWDSGEYDPSSEEDDEEVLTPDPEPQAQTQVPMVSSQYAGATPVAIDPIDKPTPTPRPELTFTYQTYTASKLGITFDGPAGWIVDDSQDSVFTLTEPMEQQKDNYTAVLSISAAPSGGQMSISDMKTEIKEIVAAIGDTNFKEWRLNDIGTRTLMDGDGVYQVWRGVTLDGTIIRGRVHIACVNRVLYTISMSHPGWYNTDYLKIHGKLRETMKLIQ